MKEQLLVALAGLVIVVIVVRFIRGVVVGRRIRSNPSAVVGSVNPQLTALLDEAKSSGKIREALRTIESKAVSIQDNDEQAAYHCAAGALSLYELKRPGLAVGFYLRALRVEPQCVDALVRIEDILSGQKRMRRLEWTYWDVLGRLDDNEIGSDMWYRCWSGLASVYSVSPRTVRRADAIRKMITAFKSDDDDELEVESGSDISAIATRQP